MEAPGRFFTFYRLLAVLATVLFAPAAFSQLSVATDLTPEEYVRNVLSGKGVEVENIIFHGFPETIIGRFTYKGSHFPIDSGMVMATGNVNGLRGQIREAVTEVPAIRIITWLKPPEMLIYSNFQMEKEPVTPRR